MVLYFYIGYNPEMDSSVRILTTTIEKTKSKLKDKRCRMEFSKKEEVK